MGEVLQQATRLAARSANARLKDSFYPIFWGSIAASTAAHFVLISTANFGNGLDYGIHSGPEMEQVEVRQEYELPPPPAAVQRPAIPVLSTSADVDPDLTIAAVTFQENPVEMLPPPPTTEVEKSSLEDQPVFTPYEVKPELKNGKDLQKMLERSYPAVYRNAGIGGRVVLWVFIDEQGEVRNTKVVSSSGYGDLDVVAQGILRDNARFSPAFNRDERVPVWIQMPVDFEAPKLTYP